MPTALIDIKRKYEDVERQDSSFALRNKMRAGWAHRENLWDADFDNNFTLCNWWLRAQPVDFARPVRPPWPWSGDKAAYRYLANGSDRGIRSGDICSRKAPADEDEEDDVTHLRGFLGARVLSRGDGVIFGNLGGRWVPIAEAPLWSNRAEVSMCFGNARPRSKAAALIVVRAFTIPAGAPYSSWHGPERGGVKILKNGAEVGETSFAPPGFEDGLNARAIQMDETHFEAGDELALKAPAGIAEAGVTLLGKLTK